MTTRIIHPDGTIEEVEDGEVQTVVRAWSVRDFMRKFTPQELIGIETLAETDVSVRVYLRMLYADPLMSPDVPEVGAALDHLVTAQVLAPGRPAEILA